MKKDLIKLLTVRPPPKKTNPPQEEATAAINAGTVQQKPFTPLATHHSYLLYQNLHLK